MTTHFLADQFENARIVSAPIVRHAAPHMATLPRQYGHSFDLPPVLHMATVGLYIAYLGVMSMAFMVPELVLPMVICVLSVVAGFGVPALWARVAPPPPGRPQSWNRFMADGFECLTGRLGGVGAATQVLILPVLIFLWGIAIAIIAASVR